MVGRVDQAGSCWLAASWLRIVRMIGTTSSGLRRCPVATSARSRLAGDAGAWVRGRNRCGRRGGGLGGAGHGVTSVGLFVGLDGLYVEGLVHGTGLGGEYFRFDEVRQELRGERSGLRYVVGTRVRVQVSRLRSELL